jgi:ferritin
MLSDKMQAALNDQINAELSAFYTYLSMTAYFRAQNLDGFAAWVYNHAQEEMKHAMKIYNFIDERRGRIMLQPLAGPKVNWDSPLQVFEDALRHEQHVTELINKLVDLAIGEGDHATHSFLRWFVDEQVEEELIVDQVIQDVKRIGDFGPGVFILDRELGGVQTGIEEEEGAEE